MLPPWPPARVLVRAIALRPVFFVQNAGLRAAEERRLQAADVASLVAAQVTTFRGDEIEEFVAATQALSTERYAGEVADLFDAELRDGLRAQDVESVGSVLNTFIQDVQGDVANAFVVVRQTYTRALPTTTAAPPIEDELQMEITLRCARRALAGRRRARARRPGPHAAPRAGPRSRRRRDGGG